MPKARAHLNEQTATTTKNKIKVVCDPLWILKPRRGLCSVYTTKCRITGLWATTRVLQMFWRGHKIPDVGRENPLLCSWGSLGSSELLLPVFNPNLGAVPNSNPRCKQLCHSCWVCRATNWSHPIISYFKRKKILQVSVQTPPSLEHTHTKKKQRGLIKKGEGGEKKKNRSFVLKWKQKMWNFKIRWLGLWFLSFKWIDLLLNCCSGAKKVLTPSAQSWFAVSSLLPSSVKSEGRSEKGSGEE